MSCRHQQVVRIFLASPSADTQEARARVVAVVDEINADPQYNDHLRLDLRRWDDPARPVICDRSGNPQQDVVKQVGSPADCELVIGLFAHTMGGPLPLDRFAPPADREEPWFCTEWEVEQGQQAGRAVWIFHDQRPLLDTSAKAKRKSLEVSEYIERHNPPGGPMREGFNPFKDENDLADRLRKGLRAWLSREFITTNPPSAPSSDQHDQRVHAHLTALVERLAQHEPRYVPLSGTETHEQRLERVLKDVVMPSDVVFEAFGFDTDDLAEIAPTRAAPAPYSDVLDAYRALPQRGTVRRLAVLGEPGAGKSFSIWRIACELARQALADPAQPVPVLVALGLWTDPDESLDDFIARCSLPPPPKGSAQATVQALLTPADLQALRAERRLLLLLDAVNEIPPGQRSAKAAAIATLAQDEHLAALVLSCRQRDFEAELQTRLPFDTLRLQPLRPWQVRDFLRQTLALTHGEKEGLPRAEDKFWQIAGGDAMREVWQVWEQAGATFELFWSAEDIPRDTPNVLSQTRIDQDELWRSVRSDERSLIRLGENPFMLFVMMQLPVLPPNRAELFDGFLQLLYQREGDARSQRGDGASVPALLAWRAVLVQVAEALQRSDGREGDDGARTALARADWPATLTEDLLIFSIDASVLQRVGDELRFTHQLLQESLAADVLLHASRSGQRPASDFWPEHYGWTRTDWEVVAEIAAEACASKAEAQIRLIDWLAQTAPNVAADIWLHTGSPVLPAEQLARSKAQWLHRMTDIELEPHPAARAAIGRWLGMTGLDNRPGVGLRADGLPDIAWVEFNDGLPFIYQDGEHPGLPPFALSRYLVTHRQFQAFVKADDGYREARWWQGFEDQQADAPPPAKWPQPNGPRETVTWFEATAFCRWLSARLGQSISLPNEHQWERAARGRDGWQYPSAAEDYPVGRANCNESLWEGGVTLQRTSAVGLYPQGATREGGLLDMAGNVCEWCADRDDPDDDDQNSGRVLRGGSWGGLPEYLRASFRLNFHPGFRFNLIGFRVCRASPIEKPDAGATDR